VNRRSNLGTRGFIVTLFVVVVLFNVSRSSGQTGGNASSVAVEVIPMKGAEDVADECKAAAEATIRSGGDTVVPSSTNPRLTMRIVIDDIFVSNHGEAFDARYVPVVAISWRVNDTSQFKHPVFTQPVLLTTAGSGSDVNPGMKNTCAKAAQYLLKDTHFWN
jgi:hypothetical protein